MSARTNDFGVNHGGPSRALNRSQRRQDEAVEKGSKRDTSIEKSFPGRARERRAEKAVNDQECVKSLLRYYSHYVARCGSLVSLTSPLYPAWIPSHCIRIRCDMNHSRRKFLSRCIDPREIYKAMTILRVTQGKEYFSYNRTLLKHHFQCRFIAWSIMWQK